MSSYLQALTDAMTMLATTPAPGGSPASPLFLGQAVRFPGTAMFQTFANVPDHLKLELPVFENTQLGISTGLSLAGHHPVVSVFPRVNFLLCALDALVLHLDAIPRYSDYRPKVIIRTAVAYHRPLDPGPQHLGDYTPDIEGMLRQVRVIRANKPEDVLPAYQRALQNDCSTIVVERAELYGDD